MKTCTICGNDIPESAGVCGFCGSRQSGGGRVQGPKSKVRTVNLESGRPTVERAMALLEAELTRPRGDGIRVVRIIHGWGSSGSEAFRDIETVCQLDAERNTLPFPHRFCVPNATMIAITFYVLRSWSRLLGSGQVEMAKE